MEITWHGHSCFTIKGSDATIVTDPYEGLGSSLPKLKANIVTHGDELALKQGELAEVEGEPKVLDWPGEFEVAGVSIEAFNASRFAKAGDSGEGENVTLFIYVIDSIKVCHLSGLAHELSDELLEQIGDVDVLLIPVGGTEVLDPKTAQKVVESVEPRVVIPMYHNAVESKLTLGGVDEFFKLMGQSNLEIEDKYKLAGRSSLPDDSMQFVYLSAKR